MGCTWRGNKKDKYHHTCAIVTSTRFKIVQDCYDCMMRHVAAREETIKEKETTIDILRKAMDSAGVYNPEGFQYDSYEH